MKKINSTIKKISIILLVILLCALSSLLIVWPLWKFSTSAPKMYTITVLAISFALIIFLIIRRIKNKKSTKENGKADKKDLNKAE